MTPEQAAEILRLREAKVAPKQIARQLSLRPAEVTAFIRDHAEEIYLEKVRSGDLQPLQECLVNRCAVQKLFPQNSPSYLGFVLRQARASRECAKLLWLAKSTTAFWSAAI